MPVSHFAPIGSDIEPTYDGDINEELGPPEGFLNRNLQQEVLDVECENYDTPLLVITFAGSGNDINTGRPHYALAGTFKDYPVSHIKVRDVFGCWYFNGVSGLSTDIPSTAKALKTYMDKFNYERVMTFGTSAGAFAAIVFGHLLEVDHILAINPPTLLERNIQCFAHGNLYRLKWTESSQWKYRDLTCIDLSEKTNIDIVYGNRDPVDIFHSNRLRYLKNASFWEYEGDHGQVGEALRDTGDLMRLLTLERYR